VFLGDLADGQAAPSIENDARVRAVLEGLVLGSAGSPAAGAVVVSSAGGQTISQGDGSYRLELELPLDAESVQVTVVGAGGSGGAASVRVGLPASSGLVRVEPLVLARMTACQPTWLATF